MLNEFIHCIGFPIGIGSGALFVFFCSIYDRRKLIKEFENQLIDERDKAIKFELLYKAALISEYQLGFVSYYQGYQLHDCHFNDDKRIKQWKHGWVDAYAEDK